MKKLITFIFLLLFLGGCAAPLYYLRDDINCYYKDKMISRDFKGNIIDNAKEYVTNLKGKIEDYLSHHPEINEETKLALKNCKVTKGLTKEQVKLLLGNPERVQTLSSKNKFKADQRWVYIMEEQKCIYLFVPIFFTHNAYHLYFRGDILIAIEHVKIKYS
jgi:hypothetical protein